MDLSPRARAFIADLQQVGATVPTSTRTKSTLPKLIEELVASCSSWTVEQAEGGTDGPWVVDLEFHPLEIEELIHLGGLIDRLLYGALRWDVPSTIAEPIRLRVVGTPSFRFIPPYPPYELTMYSEDAPEVSIAVIHAHHYNEMVKFVGACGSAAEVADAIRAAGARSKSNEREQFAAGGFRFELMRIDTSPVIVKAAPA